MKNAKFVSGLYFSNEETFKVRTLHNYYFSHECVSWVWPKVILTILMTLKKKETAKNVPGPCRLYEERLKVLTWLKDCLLHTGMSWFWLEGIFEGSMSLGGKVQKECLGNIFFYRKTLEVLTLHRYCLLPKGMPWFWPMVFWISSRPLKGNMQSLCLVCNSLLKKTLEVLLHIKIVIAVRMCFKLDPGSVVQVIVKSAFCLPRLYLEMDND